MNSPLGAALIALADAVGTASTLDDIYTAALRGLRDVTAIDRASILLFDPDGVMRFKAWSGISDRYRSAVEGHTPWVPGQAAPEPIVVEDVTADPALVPFQRTFADEQIASLAFIPIVSRRQVIGKFMLYRGEAGAFNPALITAALTFGYQIGFAVERTKAQLEVAQALQQEALVRERLAVLTRGSEQLLTTLDARTVVERVIGLAEQVVAADAYAVWRRYDDVWRIETSRNLSAPFTAMELQNDPSAAFDEPVIAENVQRSPMLEARRASYAREGIQSLTSIPLRVRDEPAGSIVFYYRTCHAPTETELRVATALGHLSAAAISNAELYAQQQELRREAQLAETRAVFLAEASVLLSSLDYEDNLRRLAELAVPTLGDSCTVDFFDNGSGEPQLYPTRMIAPLVTKGHVFGAITFVSSTSERHYTKADLAFATELARRASLAIENARLYREVNDANRLKDEFLATLSHELRTPLNVIIGRAKMLGEQTGRADAVKQSADTIERNAHALARLVDDLLDVSRFQTGRVTLDLQPVQMAAIVSTSITSLEPTARTRGVMLSVQPPPPLPDVFGDATRLQQVVWNLLSNAIKFTPAGGTVSVSLSATAAHVVLTVADTGEGIEREFLPHVFETFRQGEAAHNRRHGGLGLGLSIVRRLVELHGGSVTAASAGRGQGATFQVTLPSAAVMSGA